MKTEIIRSKLISEGLPEERAESFLVWLSLNEEIGKAFLRKCLEKIAAGEKQYSPMGIISEVRSDFKKHNKAGKFSVSNSKSPELVRLFRVCYPRYREFLKVKPLKA